MTHLSAVKVAQAFADEVLTQLRIEKDSPLCEYMTVRNKKETMNTDSAGAEASITFESGTEIMINMTLDMYWVEFARREGFYFEPYASWQVAVWKLPN